MRNRLLLLFTATFSLQFVHAQTVEPRWTWVKGDNITTQNGIYGTQGTAATTNLPGSRYALGARWKDGAGNFWIFGGLGQGLAGLGALNDMWQYGPATNNWTWMNGSTAVYEPGVYGTRGVPSAANIPAGRNGGGHWKDAAGNFWMFGGQNLGGLFLNDLCKYDPITNQWTWMHGSAGSMNQTGIYGTQGIASAANIPGGRHGSMSWTDNSGNLWLFGGHGFDATGANGSLNDLWKYNLLTNEWSWISGSSTANATGSYGTKGITAPSNVPGPRGSAATWKDNSGNFWLLGGINNGNYYNDLWKYNPVSNQWTWMTGSNTVNASSNYGTLYTPSAGNTPGGRYSISSWTDTAGDFWLFGGYGYDAGGTARFMNDLWKYDISRNQWRWVTGGLSVPAYGIYGTIGVSAPGNTPGGRQSSWADWNDTSGSLWLFGGYGHVGSGAGGYLNDTWTFTISCSINLGSDTALCYGDSTILNPGFPGMPRIWNTGDTSETLVITAPGNYWCAVDMPCGWKRDTIAISFKPLPVVDLGPDLSACSGDTIVLQSSTSYTGADYRWNNGAIASSILATGQGNYWLAVTKDGCTGTDTITVRIDLTLNVDLGGDTAICNTALPFTLRSPHPPSVNHLWSNGLSNDRMEITYSGKYWLQVTGNGCTGSDTIEVTIVNAPFVHAGYDTVICEAIPLQIGTSVPDASYQWNNDSTTGFINVSVSGDYILTVKLGPCIVKDTVSITAMPSPVVELGADTNICPEKTILLHAGNTGSTYLWSNGNTGSADTIVQAGKYWLTVTSAYHCTGSDTIQVDAYTLPVIILGRDTTVCEETPLVIRPVHFLNTDSLLWSDGSTGDRITVTHGGIYHVQANNKCGTASDTIGIRQIYCDIWIPNAFTPNGDGINDVLQVMGNIGRLQHLQLSIYNRWGELIFNNVDKYNGWNGMHKGQPCPLGTYVYVLQYEWNNQQTLEKGNITLLR